MANRPAPALVLRDGDRAKLESWLRSRSVKAGLVKRARIVLLAADGETNQEIAARVGASRTTVIQWRNRYLARGIRIWRTGTARDGPARWITRRWSPRLSPRRRRSLA